MALDPGAAGAIPTAPSDVLPRDLDPGALALLGVLRRDGPLTRTEMTAATGWARVTVTSRLERLLDVGLLVADETVAGARGRPAARYRIDARRAALLVADVGARGMRLARVDLEGNVEAAASVGADIERRAGGASERDPGGARASSPRSRRPSCVGVRHQPPRVPSTSRPGESSPRRS